MSPSKWNEHLQLHQHLFVRHQQLAGHYIRQVKDRKSKCHEAKSCAKEHLVQQCTSGNRTETYRNQVTSPFAYKNKSPVIQLKKLKSDFKEPRPLEERKRNRPRGLSLAGSCLPSPLLLPPCLLHRLLSTLLQFMTNSNLCPSIYVGLKIPYPLSAHKDSRCHQCEQQGGGSLDMR